jgi:hypothetical protein
VDRVDRDGVSPLIAQRGSIAFASLAVAVFARRRRGWWIIARIVRPRLDAQSRP